MAENPFRILLDFRELNFKFYKFVWMSISPRELLTINDLKDAILKKFSFERTDLLLFLRDGLLLEDENITNILRENDSVRLFYAEPSNLLLNDSRIINNEVEPSENDTKIKSPAKRKEYFDILEVNNELGKPNKKRKCSFSNGTYEIDSNGPPENSTFLSAVSNDTKNISNGDLYNFESGKHHKSCKIKKKLKYSNDVSQNSLISESFLSTDIIPALEKNQNKVNSCKKKKKHKHSKDISEISSASKIDINFFDDIAAASEINKNEHGFHKKKKYKYSPNVSKMDSVCETAVSINDEIIDISEKLDASVQDLSTRSELSELKESKFETVTDNSEVLKLGPVSLCVSSVSTSSGIGDSLKTSGENNQKISSEQKCVKSYVFDNKASAVETDENNLYFIQGSNCKKKKRRRHKKRRPLSIDLQHKEFNDSNLDISPQKNENQRMENTSVVYQTSDISPRKKKTSSISKSNAFPFRKNINASETKNTFLESFVNYFPSTSTPFSVTEAASPKKNVFKMPVNSNTSENQSCSVTASQNTILPGLQQKTNENSPSIHSLTSSITKNKNNATFSNHNLHEKSLSAKKNNSAESTESSSNIGIKSRFLDPNFSYKSCPPLNSCPLVGTHIAYKVLELDASYSPVVSDYKEGIVKAVNSQTDELEIELVEPEVKEGRTGKFEILYGDELPSCEVIRKITLSWSSLIDPVRVI